mgnify:CR=1 FL=1
MKLVRFGRAGQEKPGLLHADGRIRDLSKVIKDIDPTTVGQLSKLKSVKVDKLPVVKGRPRLGPPVARSSKFIAIGLNYSDHAAETGSPIPKEPVLFVKTNNTISGPNDPVMVPKGAEKMDWEVELAVVIGKRARYVPVAKAMMKSSTAAPVAAKTCVRAFIYVARRKRSATASARHRSKAGPSSGARAKA